MGGKDHFYVCIGRAGLVAFGTIGLSIARRYCGSLETRAVDSGTATALDELNEELKWPVRYYEENLKRVE